MNILWKRATAVLAGALAFVGASPRSAAQLSVGPAGLAPQAFDAGPPVSEWSTFSFGPSIASAIMTAAQLDLSVQSNAIANINLALPTNSIIPPLGNALAQWNSAGHYLQTRANGNFYTLLLATLRNDTGSNIAFLTITYDFATVVGPGTNVVEEIPGQRAYYSLTGATGTWVHIPEFDSGSPVSSGPKSAGLSLGMWPTNAPLYLLWADDNGSATSTGANQEGGYTIDNFSVQALPPQTGPPVIVSHPQSQTVDPANGATFAVGAIGMLPLIYQWSKDGHAIAGATNSTYSIALPVLADQGFYRVTVMNSLGMAASSNAYLTVNCSSVIITNQPSGQTLGSGGTISLSVGASGSAPLAYQWNLNGGPLPNATNSSFMKTNAQAGDSGVYSVQVMNCGGGVLSSNAVVSVMEAPYVLMGLTNYVWKYDESNTDLGTAWREVGYDDSTWKSGRGLFAVEDNAIIKPLTNTVLTLGSPSIITHYFRTSFVLSNDPDAVTLVASNYIDDGAVVYVNSTEAFRFNMTAPPAVITFNRLALAANPMGEGVFIMSNLPSSLLVRGTNLIAVEVHQNSTSSGDVAFGMQVNVTFPPPSPLRITSQPADVAVEEGQSAALSVGVSGTGALYQWFNDGVPIIGANTRSLTFSHVAVADAGWYLLKASNAFGVVYSRFALLTVVGDRTGPELIAADLLDASHILASFSASRLAGTAGSAANYSVTNTLGVEVLVLSAVLTNQTNVLLTTEALGDGYNYLLTATGVADMSPRQNVTVSSAPVARTVPLIHFGSPWYYFDPFPPFDPIDPGPNWTAENYDTSTWAFGPGGFGCSEEVSFTPPVPLNSYLSPTPTYAAYFRTAISSPASRGGLSLSLRYAVDDGAVFYLNGRELHRFNVPAGAPSPPSPAATATNAALSASISVPTDSFRTGDNLLAVELHQTTTNDTDKFFAMELVARAESLLTGPVLVLGGPRDATVTENHSTTLRVTAVAASMFQWQLNGADIPGATNSALTLPAPLSLDGAQVRCVCGDGSVSLLSSNATLHVLPDETRPELLSAIASADGTITLSFSKPLSAVTATNGANYTVTNSSGPAAVVAGATLSNGTNVILTVAATLSGRYTVVVNGVTDTSTFPNAVAPGSGATVGADYFIPMDSAWKYLLINTNDAVQATFMGVDYDDSSWLGPSNALLYLESAALPGPKNTLLSLFADSAQAQRINTYYFRQRFFAPVGATNATMQIRHIIDDGMILHLNGTEIYRYNMPAGAITAASQAPMSIGDATLLGPFDILNLTNLVGGANVLAAEVHQTGAASSDIVMGVELTVHVPSVAQGPGGPRLGLTPWGNQFALSWSDGGFTLEVADTITGPWTPFSASSPVFVPRTNAAAFFRLRK